MRATKSVTQPHGNEDLRRILQQCLTLTYNAIHHGEENRVSNRKGMKWFYRSLKGVDLPSCYKVAVITRACTVLESRKKGEKRGIKTSYRKPLRPVVCIISGFFVTAKGRLFIPLEKRDEYANVLLNHHAREMLEGRN